MSNLTNRALFNTYMQLKRAERELKEKRTDLEKQILEIFGDDFPEEKLSKSFHEEEYKITIKRNITYKLKEEGWEVIAKLPEEERPIKVTLDGNKAKKMTCLENYLEANETKPTIEVVIE